MAYVYQVHSPVKQRKFFDFFRNISVNLWLVLITTIAFIIFSFIPSNSELINYVAIKPSNITQGKYLWTFITSIFMHGGFFHIFANMISLLFIGSLVEKLIGRKRYFWFYIFSGLFAGAFFVAVAYLLFLLGYPQDFNTYAVGASGAIFGLVGFLMLITPSLPVYVMFIPIPIKMKYAAPGLLLVLWLISIAGDVPIGNTAHLGGLIAGLIYGVYIRNKYKRKTKAISRYFS